jgi:hypothetical protein
LGSRELADEATAKLMQIEEEGKWIKRALLTLLYLVEGMYTGC